MVAQADALTPAKVGAFVSGEAKKYGVNVTDALWIVSHESQFDPTKKGDDGQSRGLWQISRVYHPEVSDKCAFDIECSTRWSLNHIIAGHIQEWSTWRLRYKLYPNENIPL